MSMECNVYSMGVRLTLLRKRLEEEQLTPHEKEEIQELIEEIERELEV
jgi:hypothetical protein